VQPFKVHILGCGSALPTARHTPSSQIVEIRGKLFMVDCGEGTQQQVRKSRLNFTKIYAVFISHLHGDHVLGLVGMISTFGLNGRTAPLHIYAPGEYEELLNLEIKTFCGGLGYEVVFHAVDTNKQQIIYEDRSLTVESIPLCHRVHCCGFLFREKAGSRHIRRDMIDFYNIPISQINNIKAGLDWTSPEGEVIKNELLTSDPDPVRSYAYCSDTRYFPELAEKIKDVTLLYHESTYTEDFKEKAIKYLHSTAKEAAMTAKNANATQLMLGHYSQRYNTDEPLLQEARQVFKNTILANEGLIIDVCMR